LLLSGTFEVILGGWQLQVGDKYHCVSHVKNIQYDEMGILNGG